MQPQISSNSLQYTGVNAPNPPNVIIASRAPLTSDLGYPIGTIWIVKSTNTAWILTDVMLGTATWTGIGGGSGDLNNLKTTDGTVVEPVGGSIQIDRNADPGATYTMTSGAGTYYSVMRENVLIESNTLSETCSLTIQNNGFGSAFLELVNEVNNADNYIHFLVQEGINWQIGVPKISYPNVPLIFAQGTNWSDPWFVLDWDNDTNRSYRSLWFEDNRTIVAPRTANAMAGTVTLVAGAATVTNSLSSALNCMIFVTRVSGNESTVIGVLEAIPGPGSFTIYATKLSNTVETNDVSTVAYLIVTTHA